jgi:hypothetical protein
VSVIPRATQLRQQASAYAADARSIIESSLAAAQSGSEFAEVYHISLSTDTLLRGLMGAKLRPRLAGARSIVLRVPLLVGIGQQSVATFELRRFLELTCWTVYFSDHPVEWRSFERDAETGFSRDTRAPISYSAHRELGYYVEYARELMKSEPSGLGIGAVDVIKQVSHELNAAVHAGGLARATVQKPPHEDISGVALRKFGNLQRRVFSSCCILLSAYRRPQFDRLNAAARAHFDWLVGAKIRKRVRQGAFGLSST